MTIIKDKNRKHLAHQKPKEITVGNNYLGIITFFSHLELVMNKS